MASSFGYASACGHGCRGPGTNIAGGTTNGGRPPRVPAANLGAAGTVQLFPVPKKTARVGRGPLSPAVTSNMALVHW